MAYRNRGPADTLTASMTATRLLAALLTTAGAAGALAATADARVVVVADGGKSATLTDVVTNKVVLRVPVGGVARAAAVSPDGVRGFASADAAVVAIDLATRRVTQRVATRGVVVGSGVEASQAADQTMPEVGV